MNSVGVLASGLRCFGAEEQALDMLALLHQEHGLRLRRSNRYIALTMLGALACVQGRRLEPDCGVYLSSGLGNIAESLAMMEPALCDGVAPMPFSFINVSSNMAGFTLASQFGLHGRNLAVARQDNAFVAALELALGDLLAGRVSQALVGAVDECVWPLAMHRRRLQVAAESPLLEGSGWLLLGPGDEGSGRLQLQYQAEAMREPLADGWILHDEGAGLPEGQSPSLGAWRFIDALAQQETLQAQCRVGHRLLSLNYQKVKPN